MITFLVYSSKNIRGEIMATSPCENKEGIVNVVLTCLHSLTEGYTGAEVIDEIVRKFGNVLNERISKYSVVFYIDKSGVTGFLADVAEGMENVLDTLDTHF